jgi:cytochrome c oxidase assembly protein subunit 15
VFFCLTVSIALFTSPGWIHGYGRRAFSPDAAQRLRLLATSATALIYTQILLGATMRHTGAGLAIPDFPLMLGHLVPPYWDPKIAIHFSHRVGALVVIIATLTTAGYVWSRLRHRSELLRPAALLVALVAVQATLGALTVLSRLNMWFNSVHVVCGALVLATSVVLTLRSWREWFAQAALAAPGLRTMPATGATDMRDARDVQIHGRSGRLQPDRGGQA